MRWHSVCYGFDPDTFSKVDLSPETQKKREYYLMLDLNRCMYMVCPTFSSKIFVKSKFQTLLVQLIRIEPETTRSAAQLDLIKEQEEQIRSDMHKRNGYDTGLSINEERSALVFALLMNLQQIRGVLYYRLLKVMVIVGCNDIECCFLMPDENSITGVLADDYYKTLIKQHSMKASRRRYKIIRYLTEGFEVF